MIMASEGKVFTYKGSAGEPLYAKGLVLGVGDSIDNYIEVDESERDAYYAEQERKQKEEELSRLLREMYPEEYTE